MPKRGLERIIRHGATVVALKGMTARAIGVVTGSLQWIIGSLLGQDAYAGWLLFMLENLAKEAPRLITLDPESRWREVKNKIRELKSEWMTLPLETKKSYIDRAKKELPELAKALEGHLKPIRTIIEAVRGAPAV